MIRIAIWLFVALVATIILGGIAIDSYGKMNCGTPAERNVHAMRFGCSATALTVIGAIIGTAILLSLID